MNVPSAPQPTGNSQYVWAVVIMVLLAVGLTLGILKLRPMSDPLVVSGAVFAILTPTTTGILSFLKSQETHAMVNSRLDAWKESMEKEAWRGGADEERAAAAAQIKAQEPPPKP